MVVLDQATKALAVRFLAPAGGGPPRRSRVFKLATNEGSWLGHAPPFPALLALWATVLACTLLVLAAGASLAVAGLVVALGGATSNMLDRAGRGAIVDFIALGWWPAFNLADVAIVAGVLVALAAVV